MNRSGKNRIGQGKSKVIEVNGSKTGKFTHTFIGQGSSFDEAENVPASIKGIKGIVMMKPQEDNLIALLDEGKLDEFRQRLNANKLEQRRQMYARVLSED